MFLTFLYALSLGFIGSFHCIGMCGPIALTLPVQHLEGTRRLGGILLYNAGRVSAYTGLGIFFGWLGRQFYLGGLQQWLSITVGGLLLLVIFFQYGWKSFRLPAIGGFYTKRIKSILGNLLRQRRFSTLYAIGFFNGLLPCGLVYFAIAGAIATGATWQGALFMTAFGTGTLPAMVAVSWFTELISLRFRNRIRRFIPVIAGIMAILLIMRGLNLGIPYISPVLSPQEERVSLHCIKP
ncbi:MULTISPECIES: sulfite exporter TauE/SafE family protein [unclassified Chitinophaga]|uniref:sulfite exporter TauE/SafE family protein n=1 Tax=unclassified Chitinophaga TaxID=2619133 RepID=UPI0009CC15D1|nr:MULTISPECIES: sulfite exporter TauE/SafE family protein [unclassified Chitinophaga]OMP79808.1 hypothetical protein BW716_07655 [[Flexibacter] sp. ATCC 35208]WPV68630.1 sulfite exporter TauE/SafE family protein [Chitinophaga sp. LS1]